MPFLQIVYYYLFKGLSLVAIEEKLFNYWVVAIALVVYGIAFILYATNVWTPTLTGIALLFGIGNAFDSIVSLATYMFLLKKDKIDINNPNVQAVEGGNKKQKPQKVKQPRPVRVEVSEEDVQRQVKETLAR